MSEDHSVRLERVENEVGTIRSEMGGLKTEMGRVQSDVKGLGSILNRIEQGVLRAQEQQDAKEANAKHSPTQVATVLITIMSMMVGGAWVIGGNIARMDERSTWVMRLVDQNEQRVWNAGHNGGLHDQPSQAGQ